MVCEKCGAPMPEEGGACPLCDWAPGMEEETVETPAEGVPAEGVPAEGAPARSDGEVVAALFAEETERGSDQIPGDQIPADQTPPKKSRKGLVIGLVCAVAAVAVGAFLLFGGKSASPMDETMDKLLDLVEPMADNAVDVAERTVGIPGDTVVLTVDGIDVTAEEYLYWLGNITNYYDMISSYSGTPMDLTREAQEGVTWDEQLKLAARDNSVLLALTPALAKEYGAQLTDEDLQAVVDSREQNIQAVGGAEMYAHQLQAMGINDRTALRMDAASALYGKFQEAWMEKTVAELSAEEMAQYAQDNDLLRAKHILLLTKDMDTGEAFSEEEVAARRAKAEDLLAQLQADPDKFDQLMNENSEDSGLAYYPDGYVFTAGEMVTEFEEGVRALEFGEISPVVESDYGFHIILRLDPDCEETRQEVATSRFNEDIQARVDGAKVTETDLYQSFTTADYYGALLEFQTTLAQPEIVDQSTATLEPDTGEIVPDGGDLIDGAPTP